LGAGRTEEALGLLERTAKQLPDDPKIFTELAQLLRHAYRDEEARMALSRASELDPDNVTLKVQLGQ
jgi:Flp pilus assembly protein TadD